MKYVSILAIFCSLILWSSCRNDFETLPNTGNLEFSRDTVFLDTIFTNIGSSTFTLKVFNRSDEDINIPTLGLARGESSLYRLNVDGLPGKQFEDIRILAKDSIFIFLETTADIQELPGNDPNFLYTDQIVFDSGSNQQEVELVTLIQDAIFLFPQLFDDGMTETLPIGEDEEGNPIVIDGFFLEDSELTFTNELPYVIFGFAAVGPGKTLNIEPGARIHFHADSGIIVANTGSIKANGAPSLDPNLEENQIIFEGDRLEPSFADTPGQWFSIWMTQGSTNNEFSFCTIKNSTIGLLMDSNDGDETLTLKDVQIYNHASNGIRAITGNVIGENVVINNCAQASLSISLGGNYTFNHCTFANYFTGGFRNAPSVSLDNFVAISETEVLTAPLNANFNNCIVYGNERRELGLFAIDSEVFNFNFSNSLIRFEDPQGDFEGLPLYDFTNTNLYTDSFFNIDPSFQNTSLSNLNIEMDISGAEGIGNMSTANLVPIDLNGTSRDTNTPDAGAYEATAFPKE